VFRVKATAGDMFLGGDDVDNAIADRIALAFARKHYSDVRAQREVFARVVDAAERLKMQLSAYEEAHVDIPALIYGFGGAEIDFAFDMTRTELLEITRGFIERTLQVCQRALNAAGWAPRDIDQVILVGGSTRLVTVRERIAHFFGQDPSTRVDPEQAVAFGA